MAEPAPADALRRAIERCGPYAHEPALPDGSVSGRVDMARGLAAYRKWSTAQLAGLRCRRDALAAFDASVAQLRSEILNATNANATAEAAPLSADLTASTGSDAPLRLQYNQDATAYNAAGAAWQASVDSYNARHPRD